MTGASEADARHAKVLIEDEAAPDRGEHCEAARVAQARGLTMWWILFVHGVVVIIEASSLIHARTPARAVGTRPSFTFCQRPFHQSRARGTEPGRFHRPEAVANRGLATGEPAGTWSAGAPRRRQSGIQANVASSSSVKVRAKKFLHRRRRPDMVHLQSGRRG